jgi:hypothetical protein
MFVENGELNRTPVFTSSSMSQHFRVKLGKDNLPEFDIHYEFPTLIRKLISIHYESGKPNSMFTNCLKQNKRIIISRVIHVYLLGPGWYRRIILRSRKSFTFNAAL